MTGEDGPPKALATGESGPGERPRSRGRQARVALEPRDLLDQVDRNAQIGAPGRRRDGQRLSTDLDLAPDVGQSADHRLGRVVDTGNLTGQCRREHDALARRALIDVGHRIGTPDGSEIGEERHCELGGCRSQVAVDPTLEPARGLGTETVAERGVGDRGRLEMRRLQQDLARAVGDLGALTAHHPGERDRTAVVGDQQVTRVEFAVDPVEGSQLLARTGTPHDDRPAQLRPVERVSRLTDREHHVIGDVHHQRDRSHPAQHQSPLQPGGRCNRCVEVVE